MTILFTRYEHLGKVMKWLQSIQSCKFAEGPRTQNTVGKEAFKIDINTNQCPSNKFSRIVFGYFNFYVSVPRTAFKFHKYVQ